MTKHTPGPWVAQVNEKTANVAILGPRRDGDVRLSDGLGFITAVNCATDPDAVMFSPMLPEQVANANLIAAAPDLLEANDLMEQYEAAMERGNDVQAALLYAEASKKRKAAIAKAKATGEPR